MKIVLDKSSGICYYNIMMIEQEHKRESVMPTRLESGCFVESLEEYRERLVREIAEKDRKIAEIERENEKLRAEIDDLHIFMKRLSELTKLVLDSNRGM
jgi:septal ring factor EnvC (AmiA/AmiB activator)